MIDSTSNSTSITIENKTGYIIHGSTGCSCCRDENFISGMYGELTQAEDAVLGYHARKTVCSQYSTNGIYTIRKIDYEQMSDNRIIINNMVFDCSDFMEFGDIANNMGYFGKYITSI